MSNSTATQIGDALTAVLQTIDSTLRIYRHPPDQLSELPCILVYARRGRLDQDHGGARNFHEWNVDFLSNRQSAQEAATTMEPYIDLVQKALWSDFTLGGITDHIGAQEQSITYELVAYEYAGKPVFGYRFIVPTKSHRMFA
ncbi:MAG: hypothetical protein AAF702_44465 [Chloroflexota bacterium]